MKKRTIPLGRWVVWKFRWRGIHDSDFWLSVVHFFSKEYCEGTKKNNGKLIRISPHYWLFCQTLWRRKKGSIHNASNKFLSSILAVFFFSSPPGFPRTHNRADPFRAESALIRSTFFQNMKKILLKFRLIDNISFRGYNIWFIILFTFELILPEIGLKITY